MTSTALRKLFAERLEDRLVLSSIPFVDQAGEFFVTRMRRSGSQWIADDEAFAPAGFEVNHSMPLQTAAESEPANSLGATSGKDRKDESPPLSAIAPFGAAIGLNFQSDNRSGGVTAFPPDTQGAVGPDHIVTFTNARYRTFNKLDGTMLEDELLDDFWLSAGVTPIVRSFDPRVLYDAEAERWYATSVDNPRQNNRILFAISQTADPTDGWTGFAVDSDSSNGRWADYPQMSFDDDGVYIGANMLDVAGGAVLSTERTTLVLPLNDLLSNPPSIANRTLLEDHITLSGGSAQGVVYGSEGAGLPARFLAALGGNGSQLVLSEVVGPVNSPTYDIVTMVDVSPAAIPPGPSQPDPAVPLDIMGRRITSKVDYHNSAYWAVQGIQSPTTGNAGLRLLEIDVNGTATQEVFISHATLDLYYGSIAVSGPDGSENVAIGFTASGPNDGQFPSAYMVIGRTSGGVTSFSAPFELAAGTATYQVLDPNSDLNRWGDYSATRVDPEDPNVFWTFQEYAIGSTTWATQVSQIILTGTPFIEGAFEPNQFGDSTMNGNLFDLNDRHAFVFALDNPGPVTIQAAETSPLDPALRLWDEDDLVLVDVDLDSGPDVDDATIDTDLDAFTRYSAEVFAEGTVGGDFTMMLDGPHQTINGAVELDASGDGATSTFLGTEDSDYLELVAPLTANGTLDVTATPQSAAQNVVINLYDSAGVELARSNVAGNGGAETINFTGAVPGESYVLRIGEFSYDDSGTVDVEVDFGTFLPTVWTGMIDGYIPFHSAGVSNDVQEIDANLNFIGDTDAYFFAVPSGWSGDFTIHVGDFGSPVDPVVAVYAVGLTGGILRAANDNLSIFNDDAEVTVSLSSASRGYIVVVADAQGDTTGDVSIVITAPSSTDPFNVAIDAVGQGEAGNFFIFTFQTFFYRFTAPANATGTLTVTVTPGEESFTFNTAAYLFDDAGNELARGTLGGAGFADIAVFDSVIPGTEYFLSVLSHDYATIGTFNVDIDFDVSGVLGDTDGDGDVDIADLNNVRNDFGCTLPARCVGDADGDGDTDVMDLNAVRNNFGTDVSEPTPVPLAIAIGGNPSEVSSPRAARRSFVNQTHDLAIESLDVVRPELTAIPLLDGVGSGRAVRRILIGDLHSNRDTAVHGSDENEKELLPKDYVDI